MRVADYIAQFIHDELKVDTVFWLVGGGSMHLNDAIGRHPGLNYICCHHEQAAAMAASAYSRYTGKIGVCIVTTGCGGTNALTGVLGAFQDRIPMLVISGQIKTKECIACQPFNPLYSMRQFGVQEADIDSIVTPITIASRTVCKKEDVKTELNELVKVAKEFQGPVWLDVPLDIQGSEIVE